MFTKRRVGATIAAVAGVALVIPLAAPAGAQAPDAEQQERSIYVVSGADSVAKRTAVADSGVDVVGVNGEQMTITATPAEADELRGDGFGLRNDGTLRDALGGIAGVDERAGTADFPPGYEGYHNYDEMVTAISDAADEHGDIVDIGSVGKSYEGRDIPLVKISDNAAEDEDQPEVLFTCNMHAREHLTTEMCLRIVDRFTEGYGSDEDVTATVDSTEIWVVPTLNPDGKEYDYETGDFAGWRKTRKPNEGSDAVGVDTNRNFPYQWGCCNGSSDDPAAEDYRGAEALDQVETDQLAEWVGSRVVDGQQQIKGHIDFHTFGELVLWPFGYTTDETNEDMTEEEAQRFGEVGTRMADTNGYTPQQASELYITDGSVGDWMWAEHGVLSFTFEMYPGSGGIDGFYPEDDVIDSETARNDDAVDILIDEVSTG